MKKILVIGAPFLIRKLFRGKKIFRKIGLILLVLIVGTWFLLQNPFKLGQPTQDDDRVVQDGTSSANQSDIRALYDSQHSGVMVSTIGHVTRILKEDNEGSRHQRFLIKIPEGLTLLVSHNIDLAPRIPLRIDDQISIYGQYEWNNKGGLLHWTHHDPDKNHPEGWVMHKGIKYE